MTGRPDPAKLPKATPLSVPSANTRMKQPHFQTPFFYKIADLVLRQRLLSLLIVIGISAAAIWGIKQRFRMETGIDSFMEKGSKPRLILEEYRDNFGRDDSFIVLIRGDVFSMGYLDQLKTLHDNLAKMNLKLDSLGKRPGASGKVPGTEAIRAIAKKNAAEDDFSDFDSLEKPGSGKTTGGAVGWGDEAGGTIVDEITSLVNFRRTRGRKVDNGDGTSSDEIVVGELLDPWPAEAALPALKKTVLADRTLVGQVVSKEADYSVILVRTQFMSDKDATKVLRHMRKLAAPFNKANFKIWIAGLPALNDAMNTTIQAEMQTLFSVASIVLIIVMILLFRHPLGVIGPLGVVIVSVIWSFGLMAILDIPMTPMTNIMPVFVMCVGIGDSVHILSVYRDLRGEGVEHYEAIRQATGSTGLPVLFTTLTTALGLLSFQFVEIVVISDLGLASFGGVLFALILSMIIIPLTLSLGKTTTFGRKTTSKTDLVDHLLNFCASRSGPRFDGKGSQEARPRRRRLVLIVALLLSVAAAIAGSRVKLWHDPLVFLPKEMPTRQAFDLMDQHLGGISNVQLLIRSKSAKGVKDIELLRGLEKLVAHVQGYEDARFPFKIVGNAISLLDVVKETYQALHGGDPAYYKLPEDQGKLDNTLFLFSQSGPEQFRRLVTTDEKLTQVSFRVRWLEATSYGPLTEHISAGINNFIGDRANISTTGAAYTVFTTVSSLIRNLLRSFSIALLVITILMTIFLREIRLALVAMVPNLMPLVLILGLMGVAGIPIDMSNLMIASIAIGIAVDDTIHFLHHFKLHHRAYDDLEAAIAHSFKHSGRALVSTIAILSLGFYVFMAGSMIGIIRFGLLIGTTVIFALLVDLIVTPALLRTIYKVRPR